MSVVICAARAIGAAKDAITRHAIIEYATNGNVRISFRHVDLAILQDAKTVKHSINATISWTLVNPKFSAVLAGAG